MASPTSSGHSPSGHSPSEHDPPAGEPSPSAESPALHYLGALVVSGLVIGLAFFVKDAPTKWIVVIVGCIMFLSVLVAFAMASGAERRGR